MNTESQACCAWLLGGRVIGLFLLTVAACWAETSSFRNGWTRDTPESVGLDSAPLVQMFDFVRERGIPVHSVQIVRSNRLVLDAYFYPYATDLRHDVASVTKSITSTLVGLAVDKKLLPKVDTPLSTVLRDRGVQNPDPRKQKLTLEHLLTMQAGWDCGFEPKEARLFQMRRSADWLQFMLHLPMVAEPGARWAYCSGNCHVLSTILGAATRTNALAFARRQLFGPLDIHDVVWPSDAQGNNHGWGDLQLHPLDMAKIGQLFLQSGRWKNRQLISSSWIAEATRPHVKQTSNRDHYGYFWWVKGADYPGMFEAVGRGGQRINVWPAKNLVIVFTGGGFEPGDLAPFILKSLKSDQPLPENPGASTQLKARLAAARNPPAPLPIPEPPAIAAQISDKTFELSTNTLNLGALTLSFNNPVEAQATLTWDHQRLNFPIGLDGVDRFCINPLVQLPQAAKGRWVGNDTFLLTVDLVAAVNCYTLKLAFRENAARLTVTLTERTGLNDEQFTGVASARE